MSKFMQFGAFATFILAMLVAISAPGSLAAQNATEESWGTLPDGREVKRFLLTNASGTRVVVAEYGALLVSVETRDRNGDLGLVTLSYDSLEEALAGGVLGSVIGRFANRIDGGGFTLDGVRHDLDSVNERSGVHIHGGQTGFHRQLWSGECHHDAESAGADLRLVSEDGHEGYPGRVDVEVRYLLGNDDVLRIEYRGTTDKPTHLNLTNHAYFNLAGKGDIREHLLVIKCEQVLETDERKVPTGAVHPVAGSAFDFRTERPVGREIESVGDGGYDHCFVIDEGDGPLVPFATLTDPSSGRTMEVATTKPGAQIFTANSFRDNPHPRWGGICFETQYFPNSPNQPSFPSSVLRPGEIYLHTTEFRFGTTGEGK